MQRDIQRRGLHMHTHTAGPATRISRQLHFTSPPSRHLVRLNSPSMMNAGQNAGYNSGICAHPDYVIQENDVIIFISTSSVPKPSKKRGDLVDFKPKSLGGSMLVEINQEAASSVESRTPQDILVCGWRALWSVDSKRLRQRILDLAR